MSSAHQAQPNPHADIQLATLWQAVKRSFKGLLVTAGIVGAVTYGVQSLMASRYTSESQIEFVAKRNNPLPESGERPSAPDNASRLDQAAINTHARALLSSDHLLKVANELKLRNRVEFNSALGSPDAWSGILRVAGVGAPLPGETEDERVLSTIRRQLVVAAIKETRFIGISFSSIDSQLAAKFANALAAQYRSSLVSQPLEETSKAVEALQPKVEQLRKEVLDAEAAVERYRASSDQFRSGPQSAPVVDQRMAGLQDELLKAEAARNEADSRWRTANELLKSGSAEVLPDVQKSALVQALIQQRVRLERQIAETSAALLPGHPRMQQLNADVGGLKRQITAEVQKVVQGIEKDARSAAIRVETVTRQINELKSKVVGNTGNEARLKELESVAKSKRIELERLQKQLEDNRTVVNIRQVPIEAQIIARALPSATPTSPRKGPSTLLATAASLILGLAFVITKALVTTSAGASYPAATHIPAGLPQPIGPGPRGGEPVELTFAPPAAVPLRAVQRAASPVSAIALDAARTPSGATPAAKSAIAELVGRLQTRTDVSAGARSLVCGYAPGIDAGAQALALAEALSAQRKRVVLIAWSLTGRPIAPDRIASKPLGFCDLVKGGASFEQVISRLPGSQVHLIQAGTKPQYPAQVLDADRLNLTLDALDEAYDQIVIAAEYREAQYLFEAIEGRFDAALVVTAGPTLQSGSTDSGTLLGFEVTGIDVVHIAGNEGSAASKPASRGKNGKAQQTLSAAS